MGWGVAPVQNAITARFLRFCSPVSSQTISNAPPISTGDTLSRFFIMAFFNCLLGRNTPTLRSFFSRLPAATGGAKSGARAEGGYERKWQRLSELIRYENLLRRPIIMIEAIGYKSS
jgi:hypothetical protein